MEPVTFTGMTRWRRADRDTCICCDGLHIYGYSLEIDGQPSVPWRDGPAQLQDVMYEIVRKAPEGVRLRITVEQVD